ncbi:hypothetical protein GH714_019455 [Hevea brasiliensis]|uniref:Cytochrome P450 n=1 Tax=Hevea brasiliensis TaxID=3981 RepID=A0A6A6MCV5_HEVBR|nr:hypothetical protein GH714_019455 [Hevea brasiliensis]
MWNLFMKSSLDSIFKILIGVELDSLCGSHEEGIKFTNAFADASAIMRRGRSRGSTSAALSWFIYMLCKNPAVQEKVAKEQFLMQIFDIKDLGPVNVIIVFDHSLPGSLQSDMAFKDVLSNPITFTALALIPSLLLLFQILTRKLKKKQRKNKYHPVGGTIFHQLLNFNRMHDYVVDLAGKYKTYRLLSPFRNMIFTTDPVNVEYILKTNFENYGKGKYNYENLKDLLGDGIFTVDGEKWH